MNCDDKWLRKVRGLLITNFIELSQALLIHKTWIFCAGNPNCSGFWERKALLSTITPKVLRLSSGSHSPNLIMSSVMTSIRIHLCYGIICLSPYTPKGY